MSQLAFKKATKQAAKLRLALVGPPGSGKTWSSLVVATALGGKIAVIDTEKGSASKYAADFDFDVLELEGSFHPRRYVEAIRAAEQAGYAIIIVDSLSHAWIGEEGGLDLHDKAVARQKTKNSYTAWSDVTPHHNALVQALVQCKCHLIATMRSKVEYVQEKDAGGRTSIRKVGTSPLMRDGVEYEFDLVGDIDHEHTLVVTKSRCHVLSDGVFRKPGEEFVRPLLQWLGGEASFPNVVQPPPEKKNGNGHALATPTQREKITDLAHRCGLKTKEEIGGYIQKLTGLKAGDKLSAAQADAVIVGLENREKELAAKQVEREAGDQEPEEDEGGAV